MVTHDEKLTKLSQHHGLIMVLSVNPSTRRVPQGDAPSSVLLRTALLGRPLEL